MGPLVLIVDNSEFARHQLAEPLRLAGFEIVEAESAQEALEIISTRKVALMISDVHMPGMDGIELSEHLHAAALPSKPPIIMISTETNAEKKARAKRAGVKAWIVKPPNLPSVIATAMELTGMAEAKTP